jgi:hypothetical protein
VSFYGGALEGLVRGIEVLEVIEGRIKEEN